MSLSGHLTRDYGRTSTSHEPISLGLWPIAFARCASRSSRRQFPTDISFRLCHSGAAADWRRLWRATSTRLNTASRIVRLVTSCFVVAVIVDRRRYIYRVMSILARRSAFCRRVLSPLFLRQDDLRRAFVVVKEFVPHRAVVVDVFGKDPHILDAILGHQGIAVFITSLANGFVAAAARNRSASVSSISKTHINGSISNICCHGSFPRLCSRSPCGGRIRELSHRLMRFQLTW
jgi:hypothetical protein